MAKKELTCCVIVYWGERREGRGGFFKKREGRSSVGEGFQPDHARRPAIFVVAINKDTQDTNNNSAESNDDGQSDQNAISSRDRGICFLLSLLDS